MICCRVQVHGHASEACQHTVWEDQPAVIRLLQKFVAFPLIEHPGCAELFVLLDMPCCAGVAAAAGGRHNAAGAGV